MTGAEELRARLKGLKRVPDPAKLERLKKAKSSFYEFVKIYFAKHIQEPENSFFRREFYKNAIKLTKNHRNLLFKAYRGAAKTTLISRFFVLFKSIALDEKHNTIIISATIALSKKTLEFIKDELESNELLINDFEITKGRTWTKEEIVFYAGKSAFKISVYGAGKKIRGENWRGHRPQLIICDDLENDKNIKTKAQRDDMNEWFVKAVMKLPARDDTNHNIIVVGTTLHHDSLLARLEARSDFQTFSYPLVRKFPENFESGKLNFKELLLDNDTLDKKSIWNEYLQDKDAFMSEYQNEPLSKESASFSGYQTFDLMPKCDAYYIGIDPALGKSKGDYFAVCVLGFYEGKFYASVKMSKTKPEAMIEKIIQIALSILSLNRPLKIAIETIQFQEFFKDMLDKRARELGIYLPIVELKNNIPKELRIDSLTPPINNAQILIDKSSLIFIDELDTYPKSAHDDGLDSVEMAWRIAKAPNFDYEKVNEILKSKRDKEKFLRGLLDK
ncbi:phage terminase large subunit [Campylobacter sp. FOBRC14]|uniref:phage terminase large subunit n=1 Tax=Campylobacter sp. FOBRC14 TaxID=936554 RepID=UPI00027A364B|nr:phage terminase large subunit [Campylobacter sp. FOBRC14]EJP75975.1 hypothetical protein HMPREF1139_2011 [Campylobacter sp. FOBRC14]